MKTLIVYDSFFGNTERIAQAMSNAFGFQRNVEILRAGNIKLKHLTGSKLLIVGSPTRGFRPTPTISKLLKSIPENGLKGIKVAAFDTRLSTRDIESFVIRYIVKTGGFAAKHIANILKKRGGDLIIPPEGFFVKDSEGPLKEGELERAAAWAKKIITTQ